MRTKLTRSLALLFILACFSFKKDPKCFEVISSTSNSWSSGANGGRKGVNYEIKIRTRTSKVHFDSVWLNESVYPIELVKGNVRNYQQPIKKNDTLMLRFTEITASKREFESKNSSLSKKVVSPIVYDGEALICYNSNKRKKYYVVKKFEKISSSPLPK